MECLNLGNTKFFFNFLILWTKSLSVTIHCKAVEQYFILVLLYLICNFGKIVSFRLGTVKSKRVKAKAKNMAMAGYIRCKLTASARSQCQVRENMPHRVTVLLNFLPVGWIGGAKLAGPLT